MRWLLQLSPILLSGCMAVGTGGVPGDDSGTSDGSGPYCDVQRIVFTPYCTACHRPGGQAPDLTFAGAKTSLIGVASTTRPDRTLVVPGSAMSSFVYTKASGVLQPNEGRRMPLGAVLGESELAALATWIDEGASLDCSGTIDSDAGVQTYHPAGFADPAVHGMEMKLQTQDCRTCHGAELSGALGPSCDQCHRAEWRTTCTFCHGGTDTMTGAPPRDLNGELARDVLTFRAHTEHTTVRNHAAYDCTQCHLKPSNVLSLGHAFDETPGHADVDFSGGLSSGGRYAGSGACSNLYCHGNGQSPGAYDHTRARPDCNSCHPGPSAGDALWSAMSGEHRKHLREGIRCNECHGSVVAADNTIAWPERHVNGVKDLAFAPGTITRNTSCNGTCHDEEHASERW